MDETLAYAGFIILFFFVAAAGITLIVRLRQVPSQVLPT